MVSISESTRLFTEENIHRFIERNCRLLYGILSTIPDTKHNELTTIGIATKPDTASEMCEKMMGDAIEVWVLSEDSGVESEKWEPEYFKSHFKDYVDVYYDNSDDDDDDGDDDEESNGGGFDGSGVDQTPESMLNCALMDILRFQEYIFRMTASASFATGRPIDIEGLLDGLQSQVSKIMYALTFSKGGYEPKFKEGLGGTKVPYWTKRQIENARISPED